jgi:hypothetical protein
LPVIVVFIEEDLAEEMTGLFCRPLAPVSKSPGSFAVLPWASSKPPASSMPNPAFEKTLLREILLPDWTCTPSSPLKAMVLDPAELVDSTAALDWSYRVVGGSLIQ